MMLHYKAIEIFTSEAARYLKQPVTDAVLAYVHDLKIAARCMVTRGIAGCYENGEKAMGRLEILSYNLPVRICILVPAAETDRVVDGLNRIVTDGIVALHDLNVLSHRTRCSFFPRQLQVRDVMTQDPQSVIPDTPVGDAARILLASIFTGLPVVDGNQQPVGMVTQGDLIRRGGLPLRLDLLSESDQARRETVFDQLSEKKIKEIMTAPVVVITEDRPLSEAVDRMLAKGLKRLPVVDGNRKLRGILSRLDIFRIVMHEAPDWRAFSARNVEVENLKHVGDILRQDVHAVLPETPIDEVIRIIDDNDIQRVVVVDDTGKLLGLISDRDLLRYFKPGQEGIWHLLSKPFHVFKQDNDRADLSQILAATTAGEVMTTDLVVVRKEMLIEEAMALMIEKALKRLPVVDDDNRFQGMISRDALLRTGFSEAGGLQRRQSH
jgi:CBS domain-containing protein